MQSGNSYFRCNCKVVLKFTAASGMSNQELCSVFCVPGVLPEILGFPSPSNTILYLKLSNGIFSSFEMRNRLQNLKHVSFPKGRRFLG
jgi:hypothetical protein